MPKKLKTPHLTNASQNSNLGPLLYLSFSQVYNKSKTKTLRKHLLANGLHVTQPQHIILPTLSRLLVMIEPVQNKRSRTANFLLVTAQRHHCQCHCATFCKPQKKTHKQSSKNNFFVGNLQVGWCWILRRQQMRKQRQQKLQIINSLFVVNFTAKVSDCV